VVLPNQNYVQKPNMTLLALAHAADLLRCESASPQVSHN
jgi:hypothetical protein